MEHLTVVHACYFLVHFYTHTQNTDIPYKNNSRMFFSVPCCPHGISEQGQNERKAVCLLVCLFVFYRMAWVRHNDRGVRLLCPSPPRHSVCCA